jgi:hypothetical protein
LISDLKNTRTNDNWLVFGDFNMVLSSDEKVGGNPIDYNITDQFRTTLDACDLIDLGYVGDNFTWHNRQDEPNYIQARLDRFCASSNWVYHFSFYKNNHLLRYGSDHNPILLNFSSNFPGRHSQSNYYSKKFEQMWIKDEECYRLIKECWQGQDPNLQQKLQATLENLHKWGHNKFGILPKRIKAAQKDLLQLQATNNKGSLMGLVRSKEKELDDLLHNEEMWWNQRSRVLWLQHGDKNTSFFHHKGSQRRRKNKIENIKDKNGEDHYVQEKIEEVLIAHFQDLFTNQDTIHINTTVEAVRNTITETMYTYLEAPFTSEEVINAIKGMKGLAAPGPDGIPALFYQTY